MTPAEAAVVLAFATRYDKREITESDSRAWADALHPSITISEAKNAVVRHAATSTEYLTVAHVNRLAARIRERSKLAYARTDAMRIGLCGDCDEHGYRHDRPRMVCRHDHWQPAGLERARRELTGGKK